LGESSQFYRQLPYQSFAEAGEESEDPKLSKKAQEIIQNHKKKEAMNQ